MDGAGLAGGTLSSVSGEGPRLVHRSAASETRPTPRTEKATWDLGSSAPHPPRTANGLYLPCPCNLDDLSTHYIRVAHQLQHSWTNTSSSTLSQ
ncbi:hypothetical protein PsYK624_158700 [Phanerochaete sordida]|uniref:Uncharacterized protein n=1 Tax=Phanerochaete sordida TaxID=48140 RepID=A0A9P3GPZ5_9APHY|nr:hypothetical protein PsYK624_158700 [Phanerochaete sordida]